MALNSSHVGSIDESTFLPLASSVMFSTSSFLLLLPYPSNHLQRFLFLQLFLLQMVLNTKYIYMCEGKCQKYLYRTILRVVVFEMVVM